MKRILINATHNEEVRVAICKDNHLYDFDLENRTREQKKSNVYKGYVTRVEPSLEAVFVEYGSARQGFLPLREIAPEYLNGSVRDDNIKKLIKEGDEVLVQVSKEERGNKGAALTTYISLAGRYLVLMPNNARGGGISRQISGKVREEMRQIINDLTLPKGMSVIVRTAGIGKTFEDLQHDLDHLLQTWQDIQKLNREQKSPFLMHQEASVVTRAMRDYLRDDIGEVWIDNENAYNEAASFIAAVMPAQMHKLRKYTDFEPMFGVFGIERQIETAYQREVRLPSGGSIVIDQTEALVSIDINSAKSTKGSDVAETAYHTNLEAAEEIARQLRLRDMGGLIVIDFIDMNDAQHQKNVEKRLIEATRYDRARVQFAEISRFGLLEMSRQRLRPSLEEATGYLCPRCHGNGIIRDLRSLSLSIMRQIEQLALKHRSGEIQAEVPTEIAAFLLNEKRESLVYLEQDSGTRVTILPHAHLESPNFSLHFNPDGFAPASYERIVDAEEQQADRGYDVNWQTQQAQNAHNQQNNHWQQGPSSQKESGKQHTSTPKQKPSETAPTNHVQAVAWLSNLFAPKPQAKMAHALSNEEAAAAIESIVNTGASSLGAFGQIQANETSVSDNKTGRDVKHQKAEDYKSKDNKDSPKSTKQNRNQSRDDVKGREKDNARVENKKTEKQKAAQADTYERHHKKDERSDDKPRREPNSRREPRAPIVRDEPLVAKAPTDDLVQTPTKPALPKPKEKETNFALRILPLVAAEAPAKVVHLSLDTITPSLNQAQAEDIATPKQTERLPVADTPKKPSLKTADLANEPSVQSSALPLESPKPDTPATTDVPPAHKANAEVLTALAGQTLKIDDEALSAIATESKLAKNDPRVVYQALYHNQSHTLPKITGLAGEFIKKTLPNADDLLKTQGFVRCFVQALALISQPAIKPDFDFSNYGYASLSAEYVGQFDHMVAVRGQFAVAQGKTEAVPKLSVRAKNDPRGELPESPQTKEQSVVPADTKMPDEAKTSATHGQVADIAKPMIDPILAKLDELGDELADTLSIAKAHTSDVVSQMLGSALNALESTLELNKSDDGDEEDSTQKLLEADPVKMGKKNKSTHYKDMIENVAEQLLPQTGILNLNLPKPVLKSASKTTKPKVRIKKPKSEGSNKPKIEVVKRAKSEEQAVSAPPKSDIDDTDHA